MEKEEFIRNYGVVAYKKRLQQTRDWQSVWRGKHSEEVKANNQEINCKGGKYYDQTRKYDLTGVRHKRKLVRMRHQHHYRPYKQIIAPESQLHHEWLPEKANFRGVALVEADQHMHGFIDVIQILEGEITVFSEAELLKEGEK